MTRTIVVAGATSGLVRRSAEDLAAAGHRLVLIGRDPKRAADLQRRLPGGRVVAADLSTADGVARAAAAVQDTADRIDTLVNGAGVMLPNRRVSAEGLELNLAVHHLAPFSLTSALLPLLQEGDGRVVNVNSEGHRAPLRGSGPVVVDLADLQSERRYDPFLVYSRTKLANLLFTYELHRRHPDLTVVALHPGMVRTDLGRHFPRALVLMASLMSLSVQQGADPVTRLAADDVVENGAYYDRFRTAASSPASYDRDDAARLWQLTEQLRGPFSGTSAPRPGTHR
ncbi:SDR family NAD(P)-dependent oxidoreductase [Jiangella alkaliphila]|uniref:Short-chain dehydrogenase n=1 Tax=Jiangella alkaliphila TaxID=419479 RepID=A0A1H2K908_9ACTN|nr:SDR family NAD(P)-dependent oxidoreductase [Jiangella alkaliphila]SDU64931.1 Short-chain dehydrogenase [Jiangella alkaliphila]